MSVSKPRTTKRHTWTQLAPASRTGRAPNDTGLDGSVGGDPELAEIGTFPEPEATDLHQFVGGVRRRWSSRDAGG